jgi:CHASE2 domain-containing sensor protein
MDSFFDAFISYGRADSKAFATKLHNRLVEQGLKVWFDQNDIPLGVDFQEQIYDGIEKSNNFLFIIAPHSVKSAYCLKEILWAIEHNKRIIPLLHVEPKDCWDQMHPTIGKINWIYFQEEQDDFEAAFAGLIDLMHRHSDYVEQQTRILVKALDWERHQKQNNYLLTGEERQQAESWLKRQFKDEQPPCQPTDLQCEFISESIKNANNLMTHVFISYADPDQDFLNKISKTLKRNSFTIWTNKTDIKTGTEFQKGINKGIEGADNVIWLISPHSLQSWYCQEEITHAFDKNKRIIPLLIEPTELNAIPPHLRALQFIDFTTHRDEVKYKKDADKLLKLLNQDAAYYEQHKFLLVKALKWLEQNRNPSILLRGYNFKQAEAWLKVAEQRTVHPPLPLHEEFISESAKQPPEASLDVFIAYSRVDSDFARTLNDALQIQGKTTWFDQESIASGADFQKEIYRGIESTNNFLFIISPSSVNSPYCADEVEYARKLNKRIVTVLHRAVPSAELHPDLASVQWIDFNNHNGDFYANFGELVRTLDTDLEYMRSHTRLLLKALEWEREKRDPSYLLRGKNLADSEQWLKSGATKHLQPTELQTQYITTSRKTPYFKPKLHTAILTSLAVTALVVGVRYLGLLQPLELETYDQMMRRRPSEAQDKRFLIVEIREEDISALNKKFGKGIGTVPDKALALLLEKLNQYQPRLIGYDLYRDFDADPVVANRLRNEERFIGICKLSDTDVQGNVRSRGEGISPPPEIPVKQQAERVGFNDAVFDSDGTIRRHLIVHPPDLKFCPIQNAFSLLIARRYLETEGKRYHSPATSEGNIEKTLRFDGTSFKRLTDFSGGYQGQNTEGYQILLNYRTYNGDPSQLAPRVSIQQVLNNQISEQDIKDRIILVGITAISKNDIFPTLYGKNLYKQMPGVIIHAQMASQLISAVLEGRPLIWWFPFLGDVLWIGVWSIAGGLIIWRYQKPLHLAIAGVISLTALFGLCYIILAFHSGWIPAIPPALALLTTTGLVIVITYQFRH